ncbi:hypothetical protein ACWOE3_10845 [Enterococcus dispar]|uniref:DUF3168 domain-containing protein n=1 Tax=Enterococcus dispar ATCC 51266 TaxID=1139219 RepID=S0KS34_9ENTE|nr:hypothetical protein [Enterococcus dispar]EOT43810.1 hypothetical protein OMK_00368 [Enterococcus dispar ATCC 51266]EOW85518.1 hypothetical protein I569_00831 [Enterococcus dispar ATCC 51266]
MKYMMIEVYEAIKNDTTIASLVDSDRIKFFEAPETLDTSKPFIIIDSTLGPSTSAYFAANKEMSKQFSYQINVESTNYLTTKKIAKAVQDVMRKMEFGQLTGGLDTYFAETKRYVDARRYRKNTKIHDTDY